MEAAHPDRLEIRIAEVMAIYDHLDLAVLSVGSWDPPITQLMDSLSPVDRAHLDRSGARAEMAGIFIEDRGHLLKGKLPGRRLSLSADQLIQTPEVVAVAGGLAKAQAIAAIARSRIRTLLITDRTTALALLAEEPVPPGARRLPGS